MNIHEYQAKDLFRKYGLNAAPGRVFQKNSLSVQEISKIGPPPFVVKAQIHAGGRGKAGGIQIVDAADAAFGVAKKMLGTKLKTYQTAGVVKLLYSVPFVLSRAVSKSSRLHARRPKKFSGVISESIKLLRRRLFVPSF